MSKNPNSFTVGWFVEIPRSLKVKFDELYPGRRNKKILTITAIQHAIAMHPKSLHNLYKGVQSGLADAQEHEKGSSSDVAGSEEVREDDRDSNVKPESSE